jgi:hypothetical protein
MGGRSRSAGFTSSAKVMLNAENPHAKWIKDAVQITSHAMNRIRKMFHLNYPHNAAANLVREHYLLGPVPRHLDTNSDQFFFRSVPNEQCGRHSKQKRNPLVGNWVRVSFRRRGCRITHQTRMPLLPLGPLLAQARVGPAGCDTALVPEPQHASLTPIGRPTDAHCQSGN